MKILHFIPVYLPALQFGGPVLSVSRLCEALVGQGVDIRVITTNAGLPEMPQKLLGSPQTINNVSVTYYPTCYSSRAIFSDALVSDLDQHISWADAVHLSSVWQPLGTEVQKHALKQGVPYVQTPRGALGSYSLRRKWWKKLPYLFIAEYKYLRASAALHCTSEMESKELEWLQLKSPKYIIPNPIQASHQTYDPLAGSLWRKSNQIPSDVPLFIVAGRLHHKKGLTILPRLLALNKHLPWNIVFIGNDDDGTGLELKRCFHRFGLTQRCYWFDSLPPDELSRAFNAADWLLLPSHHENFGNVVIEALGCGCGVLISSRVGAADCLKGCPGVFIRQRDVDLWSDTVSALLTMKRPGLNSTSWVQSRLSDENIARMSIAMYMQLLNND